MLEHIFWRIEPAICPLVLVTISPLNRQLHSYAGLHGTGACRQQGILETHSLELLLELLHLLPQDGHSLCARDSVVYAFHATLGTALASRFATITF